LGKIWRSRGRVLNERLQRLPVLFREVWGWWKLRAQNYFRRQGRLALIPCQRLLAPAGKLDCFFEFCH
jgi:hypothetical protein